MPSKPKFSPVRTLKPCKSHQYRTATSPRRCINIEGSSSRRRCSPSTRRSPYKSPRRVINKSKSPKKAKSPRALKPCKPHQCRAIGSPRRCINRDRSRSKSKRRCEDELERAIVSLKTLGTPRFEMSDEEVALLPDITPQQEADFQRRLNALKGRVPRNVQQPDVVIGYTERQLPNVLSYPDEKYELHEDTIKDQLLPAISEVRIYRDDKAQKSLADQLHEVKLRKTEQIVREKALADQVNEIRQRLRRTPQKTQAEREIELSSETREVERQLQDAKRRLRKVELRKSP